MDKEFKVLDLQRCDPEMITYAEESGKFMAKMVSRTQKSGVYTGR